MYCLFVCLEKPLACWIVSIFLLEFPHDETCALNCESFNLLGEDHCEARYQFVDDSRTDLRSRSGSLDEEKILLQRHTVLDRQMVSNTQAKHQVLQNTSIECVYYSSVSGRNARLPVQLCLSVNVLANLLIIMNLVVVYLLIPRKPFIPGVDPGFHMSDLHQLNPRKYKILVLSECNFPAFWEHFKPYRHI